MGPSDACFTDGRVMEDIAMNGPMPLSLQVVLWFTVTDSNGRILRTEEVRAGADLHDRLRLAHRNYQQQGWNVEPLLSGRWNFLAEKAGRRILIGIRPPRPEVTYAAPVGADRRNQHRNPTQDSG
jgi:hypothetical protein